MKAWDIRDTLDQIATVLGGEQRVTFSNPDVHFLTRRHRLQARFIARMLRIFGEPVVLEALRRYEGGTEDYFYGICKNVEASW